MNDRCCGCSLKLRVSLFLWIEAILFTNLLFQTLTEIEAYGSAIHTSCILAFTVIVVIKFLALYGLNKNKSSFLIPQMASQITEIILIAYLIYACLLGFSFMSEVIDHFINKSPFLEELAAKTVNFLRNLVVAPLITIFVVKCCLAKMVYNYYASLVSKKVVTDVSTKTDNPTTAVDNIPMQPLPADVQEILLEATIQI